MRPIIYLAYLVAGTVPIDQPLAIAERVVVVPATDGKDCVDLDSRWGVGAIVAWKQSVCRSNEPPVWVQTDCSQEFGRNGYWVAISADGRNFDRKVRYDADQSASSIARFVCLSIGR